MLRRSLLLSLPAALAAYGAKSAEVESSQVLTAGPFKLRCPKKWAEGVKIEKVPDRPIYSKEDWQAFQKSPLNSLKGSYSNRPEHWAIRFPKLRPANVPASTGSADDDETAPQILIHRADGWAGISRDGTASATDRKKHASKLRAGFDKMLKNPSAFDICANLDASFHFMCLKQPLTFKGGRGVRMIGQWTIESSLLSRGSLHYLFIGMSDDDTCYVIATFPIDLEGLPAGDDAAATHLGYSMKQYEELDKNFADYEKKAKAWLADMEPKMQPSLKDLDAMIESLEAETWS